MDKQVEIEQILNELRSIIGFFGADLVDLQEGKAMASVSIHPEIDTSEISRIGAEAINVYIKGAVAAKNPYPITLVQVTTEFLTSLQQVLGNTHFVVLALESTGDIEAAKIKLAEVSERIKTYL